MPYTKKLTFIGNSVGLVLDRPILAQLGIEPDGLVDITVTDDGRVIVTAHREAAPQVPR